MKKIGLVCNYYMLNYGSLLQCYATQKIMQDMGYDVEAIQFENTPTKEGKKQQFLRLQLKQFLNPRAIMKKIERIKNTSVNEYYLELRKNRKEKFNQFIEENLTLSKAYHNLENVQKDIYNYDEIVLGSDQLLCPKDILYGYHSLEFVPNDIRKISYAASFGLSQLPRLVKKKAARDLERFDYFAAREITGAKIYKSLTGKEVQVVVDPTFLLEKEQWQHRAGDKPIVQGKYIYCYFIGDNQEHRNIANKLKEKKGLKLVTIRHIDDYIATDENFGDIAINDAGPKEFINLILNAEYVLTDSFHATIFSIMYHKKFITLNRFADGSKGSTNSRIDSLLGKLKLENRRINSIDELDEVIDAEIGYEGMEPILKQWISDSKEYLRKSLGE